ncbi:hypothetical protein ACWGCW_13955 [Streptomyces sp. NPDC054933]
MPHDLLGRNSRHLQRQFLDIAKLRAASDEVINDTIPLDAGIKLFESAKQLVVASAGSTLLRQSNFGRNMPKRAINHVKNVRLGHAIQGSCIVPIISEARVPDLYAINGGEGTLPSLDIQVEESRFDRRVVATMAHALGILQEIAVTRDHMPAPAEMNDAVAESVSRELCDAIFKVLATGQVEQYDVTFQWAPAAKPPSGMVERVEFPKESTYIGGDIAEHLRSTEMAGERVVFGVITNLRARPNDGIGQVTVQTAIESKVRTVKFDLDWESFRRAGRYITERRPVFVRGVLHMPSGRPATMEVRAFGPDPSTMTFDDALELTPPDVPVELLHRPQREPPPGHEG